MLQHDGMTDVLMLFRSGSEKKSRKTKSRYVTAQLKGLKSPRMELYSIVTPPFIVGIRHIVTCA